MLSGIRSKARARSSSSSPGEAPWKEVEVLPEETLVPRRTGSEGGDANCLRL